MNNQKPKSKQEDRLRRIDRFFKLKPNKSYRERSAMFRALNSVNSRSKIRKAFIKFNLKRLVEFEKKNKTIRGFKPVPLSISQQIESCLSPTDFTSRTKIIESKTGAFIVQKTSKKLSDKILDEKHQWHVLNMRALGFRNYCSERSTCPRFIKHFDVKDHQVIRKIVRKLHYDRYN